MKVLIDRIDIKKTDRLKRQLKEECWQQQRARERLVVCFGDRLGDKDRRLLAQVLAVEENALQLCEAGTVGRAISLLKEQEGTLAAVAVDILQRV